jgi:hypothetical protein
MIELVTDLQQDNENFCFHGISITLFCVPIGVGGCDTIALLLSVRISLVFISIEVLS